MLMIYIPCSVAWDISRLAQYHFDLATVMCDCVKIRNGVTSLLTLKQKVKTLSSQVFDTLTYINYCTAHLGAEIQRAAVTALNFDNK